MRTRLTVAVISVLLSVPGLGQAMAADGEVIAKVTGYEWVREHDRPLTKFRMIVLSDSSYQGQSLEPGTAMELWSPGGDGGLGVWDMVDGSLSTVSMIVGEKVFCLYRQLAGRLFVTAKWTVWKLGAAHDARTDSSRAEFLKADIQLEEFLSRYERRNVWADSLELFPARPDPGILRRLEPPVGRSWRDYGLVCGRTAETLRALRERLRGE